MKKSLLLAFLSITSLILYAQKIKYPKDFLQKLTVTEIDLFEPVEGKYKSKKPKKNNYQSIDHLIYSKEEGIEIRYRIIPYQEENPTTQIPHVEFMRVISSIAPNEEDTPVTVHTIPSTDLRKQFNADWGSIAYFQPKPQFAAYKHCRFVSLFGDKRGTIHIFFLFDEPSAILDDRLYSMRFQTKL